MTQSKSVFLRAKECASLSLPETLYKIRGILPLPLLLLSILWSRPNPQSLTWGLVLVAGGELVRLWVAGFLGGQPIEQRDGLPLVEHGPYSLMRHPRQIGNFLIGMGLSVAANWWIGYLLYFGYCLLVIRVLIPVEEDVLVASYGDEYRQYCARYIAFVRKVSRPSLAERVLPKDAFASERSCCSSSLLLGHVLLQNVCFW